MTAADDRKNAGSASLGADVKREASAASGRVGDDIKRAKENIAEAAAEARDSLGDDLRRLSDDVASLRDTVAQLAEAIGAELGEAVTDIGGEVASSARRQATTVLSEVEDMTRRNPLGFMAGAFLLGMLIGVMRSR